MEASCRHKLADEDTAFYMVNGSSLCLSGHERRRRRFQPGSIATLAIDSEVILSFLSNDEAVHAVYFATEGIFSAVKPDTIILEKLRLVPSQSDVTGPHKHPCGPLT